MLASQVLAPTGALAAKPAARAWPTLRRSTTTRPTPRSATTALLASVHASSTTTSSTGTSTAAAATLSACRQDGSRRASSCAGTTTTARAIGAGATGLLLVGDGRTPTGSSVLDAGSGRRTKPVGHTPAVRNIRVATIPGTHPYLDAVLGPGCDHVQAPVGADPWAPSPWFDHDRLAAAAPGVDLVHVHFGFDHLSTAQLRDWADHLAGLGVALVVTVHDLRNPHHDSPHRHDEHLGVLLPVAAEVITLTAGAAAVIAQRWGRAATVIEHPAVLAPDPAGPPTSPGLVGIHLKSLRRNLVEPGQVVAAGLAGARAGGGRLRVDAHPEVLGEPALAPVRALASAGALELQVHPRFSDAALGAYLQRLHVSVLGNRHGTHSGWLEACRDVGTAVVAPTCGFYAEQWPAVHSYTHDEHVGLDPAALSTAVAAALSAPPPRPAGRSWRAEQRAAVRARHHAVYARALHREDT